MKQKKNKNEVEKGTTAALADEKERFGDGQIVIPREQGVREAKNWVDNENQK